MKPIRTETFQEGRTQYVVVVGIGFETSFRHYDDLKSAMVAFEAEPDAVRVYSREIMNTKRVYAEREM